MYGCLALIHTDLWTGSRKYSIHSKDRTEHRSRHRFKKYAGYFFSVGFFTAAVWCVPALRVPLVHSQINHFRQNIFSLPLTDTVGLSRAARFAA